MRGIVYILLSCVAFTAMGVFTKLAVTESGAMDTVFWRSVIVAIVAACTAGFYRESLRPQNLGLLLTRSAAGFFAMTCYFWALRTTPLATATVLLSTSPVFTVLLAKRFNNDDPDTPGALPLVLLAFGGVALIVGPTELQVSAGTIACLAAGLSSAIAYLAVRKMRDSDPPSRIVFWFSIAAMLGALPFTDHHAFAPTTELALNFGLVGLTAAVGQLLMTAAYRVERAAIIGPFSYGTPVFTYGVGLVLFPDEHPTLAATLGIVLVLVANARLSGIARRAIPAES